MAEANIIKIDGKDYELDALSDDTKRLLGNLRIVDREIARLRQQLAIAQTARATYANGVKITLPADAEETAA